MISPSIVKWHKNGSFHFKTVKNLGYLLRNWQLVKEFSLHEGFTKDEDCYLIAYLSNGMTYETGFSCSSVLWQFLHRSIFYGLKIGLPNNTYLTIGRI